MKFSIKLCTENHNTHFMSEYCTVYELMWLKLVTIKHANEDNLNGLMRFTYWISKAAYTQSDYERVLLFKDNKNHTNAPSH
jgi:hypothetical protein